MKDAEYWQRVEELFDSAARMEPGPRASFLESIRDEELRGEVRTLLEAEAGGASDLEDSIRESIGQAARDITYTGRMLGHYSVLERLATGGMSEVYLALDPRLARKVALKLLPRGMSSDGERVQRFQHEARAASALNHPNILTIYDIGEAGGQLYIAMEFVEGEPLHTLIANGPLPVDEVLAIAKQIATALEAAHEAGILHRDIKPGNVIRRADGLVKVLDFGLARSASLLLPQHGPVTIPGTILGTPAYMSPEQARGREVDARADLWSLGAVLYELLSGVPPFTGGDTADILVAVLDKAPKQLAELRPDLPPRLSRLVHRLLSKDVAARYGTAREVLDELQAIGLESSTPAPRTRRWRAPAVAAGAAALALFAAVGYQQFHPPPPLQSVGYTISAEQKNGTEFSVRPGEVLPSGSRFRLQLRPSEAGYLYLVGEDRETGGFALLFPLPSINAASARIQGGEPLATGWYQFSARPGKERLWLVWATSPVPVLENLRKYLDTEHKGAVSEESDRAAIRSLVGRDDLRGQALSGPSDRVTLSRQGEILTGVIDLVHE